MGAKATLLPASQHRQPAEWLHCRAPPASRRGLLTAPLVKRGPAVLKILTAVQLVQPAGKAPRCLGQAPARRLELAADQRVRRPQRPAGGPRWNRRFARQEPVAELRLRGECPLQRAPGPLLMAESVPTRTWRQNPGQLHPRQGPLPARFAEQPRVRSTRFPERMRATRCQARASKIRCQRLWPAPSSQLHLPARRPSHRAKPPLSGVHYHCDGRSFRPCRPRRRI